MLRQLFGATLPDLSQEKIEQAPEIQLVGLKDERHREDAGRIWKGLAGLAQLNQFQLTQRLSLIMDAADTIISRESSNPTPSPRDDRWEIAQLFRTAAAAGVTCSSDLESVAEWSTRLLNHARRLEAVL